MKFILLLGAFLGFHVSSFSQNWVQKASLPISIGIQSPFSFSIGGMLYVGGGYNGTTTNGFYKYNPIINTWTTLGNLPTPNEAGYGFVLNGMGYLVCGYNGNLSNKVYMYNPATDTWTPKNNFPGSPRQNHVCFSANGYGYLFAGFTGGSTVVNDMWQYNNTTDTWIQMASCPGPGRDNPVGLVINNQIYVGMGGTSSASVVYSDFYLFDPITNAYTQMQSNPAPRTSAANFAIGDTGYVGLGFNSSFQYLSDIYSYNPNTNTWTQITSFTGVGRANVFNEVVNGLPYVGCGRSGTGQYTFDNWTWAGCHLIVDLGNDTTLCAPATITLMDTLPNATYLWSTGDTTASITVSTSGSYWLQVKQDTCIASDTINVTFVNTPAAFNLGIDTAYCTNFTRTLSINTPNVSYRWSTGATTSGITVSAPGLYWGQDSNMCGIKRDSIVLTQNAPPIVNLGNDTTLCVGASLILNDTSTNATFLWSTNATTSSINVTTSGAYWLQVTQRNCPARDTIVATFLSPSSPFSLGNDTAYCTNFTRTLSISIPNVNYRWNTGATTSSITISAPGLYWGQDSSRCGVNRDTIVLTQNAPPVVNLGNDTTLCVGASLILNDTSANATFLWSTNATTSSINVTTSGTYWLQVTQQNCPARDSIVATFLSPSSTFNLGNDTAYCSNFTRTLSISIPNVHYQWNTGATTSSITVSAPGLYWGQDSSLCGVKRDTIVLTQNTPPIVNLGNDTTLCVGASLILNDTSTNATFLWSTTATTSSINVTTSGTYWLQVTQQNCPAIDTIVATFHSPPAAFNLGNDTAYCTTFTRTLSISVANVSYRWSTGATISGITVSAPGLYWGQDSSLCGVSRDSIVLTQNVPPIVNLGNDTTLCVGASLILNDTSTNAAFLWSTNATTSSISIDSSGTYWLQVTQNNCPGSDTLIATFLSPPPAFSLGNDTSYCGNFTRILSTGGASARWSTGADTSTITVSAPGVYWAEVSNICGISTDTVRLYQNPLPVVNLGPDTTICDSMSYSIPGVSSAPSVVWTPATGLDSLNIVNPTFKYPDSVSYMVIATFDSTGCADTAYLNIGVDNCNSYIDGPQAFSPNGDGANDYYTLFANKIAEYDMRIYNRWGEMVFEDTNLADLNDTGKGWDGKYQGKPQEVGVFVYYIIATDDYHKKISKKGNITLLR
jgi:gliding motility-associated-like protein